MSQRGHPNGFKIDLHVDAAGPVDYATVRAVVRPVRGLADALAFYGTCIIRKVTTAT